MKPVREKNAGGKRRVEEDMLGVGTNVAKLDQKGKF